ncbi:hypothetical protein CORC01_12845 [Colletotrichum orchidophilum]|uniref:Uncharacterized protein n=1 Tax=Colletotrichum orchidophilum TaxID=1209926 RepID=A0A1G4ARN5_9PEZI|nr:uncharacterized protein CORC01_12845 [Colletotrichum orchidophilum]OHE91837.1 hypothetical protein CORC01_12845 [Colletotrichum orchidophilum]
MESRGLVKKTGQGQDLVYILRNAAESSSHSIIAGDILEDPLPTVVSYSDLLRTAYANAHLLQQLCPPSGGNAEKRRVVLLCLDNILDTIIWFWSAVIARLLPAISTASVLSPTG